MQRNTMILAALAFVLAACFPGQNPVDVQPLVNTAVAQTMEAERRIEEAVAQTVAAQQVLSTPTVELTPTATATATFERITIVTDTPPPFPTFPTNTPPPPVVKPLYSCFVTTRSPANLEEIRAGAPFEIRWTVINTGTRTWNSGVDVKFESGAKMTNASRVEIPVSLAPNESYKISLSAHAPSKKGVQRMTWVVEGNMCYAQVVITVK